MSSGGHGCTRRTRPRPLVASGGGRVDRRGVHRIGTDASRARLRAGSWWSRASWPCSCWSAPPRRCCGCSASRWTWRA
ncbi:MAG: hypothetical protein M0C28_24050 [Candidatus Moduliflexus flocculans]|nr:hypothetical protein [Candidatus Moduliflexus flocculans]